MNMVVQRGADLKDDMINFLYLLPEETKKRSIASPLHLDGQLVPQTNTAE